VFQLKASPKVRRMQRVVLSLLVLGGAIAYIDRATLSVANPLVRHDLSLSVADMGMLLSAFLWAYAFFQVPMGGLIDRLGARLALGLGMVFWSFAQILGGLASGFGQFVGARALLGLGESPQFLTGTQVSREWFHVKDRGLATGIYNCSAPIGTALSAPLLTALMLAFGWRWMFALMGLAGLFVAVVWFAFYRSPQAMALNDEERAYLNDGDEAGSGRHFNFSEWCQLFQFRSIWGLLLGHFGEIYMLWLFYSWLPGYLEMERHMSVKTTGMVAAIPFLSGAIGGFVGGWCADWLMRAGFSAVDARRYPMTISLILVAVCTFGAAYTASDVMAIALISVSLFLNNVASSSVLSMAAVSAPKKLTGSVAGISGAAGYVGGALAPTVTGFIVQSTGSFAPALVVGSAIAVLCAIAFFVMIRAPLTEDDLASTDATCLAGSTPSP
jgi:sugar phosphate permease